MLPLTDLLSLYCIAELSENQQFLKLFKVLPESVKATRKGINPRAEIFQLGQLPIHPAGRDQKTNPIPFFLFSL